MTLIHWEPFQALDMLRQQVGRLFEDLHRNYSESTHLIHNLGPSWQPAIEIQETDTQIILKVEMPGIDVKDLDVQVSQDSVSITGEHRREELAFQHSVFQSEFHYGQFRRNVPLAKSVRKNQVKTKFTDGVLVLMLPKMEEPNSKVVKVNLVGNKITVTKPMDQAIPQGTEQAGPGCKNKGDLAAEHLAPGIAAEEIQIEAADQQVEKPSSLEDYCSEHPEASPCRIYD